jgi:hypothetical protein
VIETEQQFCLVRDGEIIVGPTFKSDPSRTDGTWLNVVNEDSQPFDRAKHWRLAPSLVVHSDRVVRLYPIVEKSWAGL